MPRKHVLSCILLSLFSSQIVTGSSDFEDRQLLAQEELKNRSVNEILVRNRGWLISSVNQLKAIEKQTGRKRFQALDDFTAGPICTEYVNRLHKELAGIIGESNLIAGLQHAGLQDIFTRDYDNTDISDVIADANYALGQQILRRLKRETLASATLNDDYLVVLQRFTGLLSMEDRESLTSKHQTCMDKLDSIFTRQSSNDYTERLHNAIDFLQRSGYLKDVISEDTFIGPFENLDQMLYQTLAYLQYRDLEAEISIQSAILGYEDSLKWQAETCVAVKALLKTTYPENLADQPDCAIAQQPVGLMQSPESGRSGLPTLQMHKQLSKYTRDVRSVLSSIIAKHNWLKHEFLVTDKQGTSTGTSNPATVNPNDYLGRIILKELYAETLASAILWDNYQLSIRPILDIFPYRVQDIPAAFSDSSSAIERIRDRHERNIYAERLAWGFEQINDVDFNKILTRQKPDNFYRPAFDYEKLLATTTAKRWFDENKRSLKRGSNLRLLWDKTRTQGIFVARGSASKLSKAFGNTLGMIHSGRKGRLHSLPQDDEEGFNKLKNYLRPLDILLEKSRFLATDKTIPGHYGHVAVWMGNEEELKALGVWDENMDQTYIDAKLSYGYMADVPYGEESSFKVSIQSGRSVLEALRDGVQLNSLEHFLNIDDLAVLRFNFCDDPGQTSEDCLTRDQIRTYLKEGWKQVGKSYDFAFDTETEAEIVCSELVIRMFIDQPWKTSRSIGPMNSISPDQVAVKADWLDSNLTLKQSEIAIPVVIYDYVDDSNVEFTLEFDEPYQAGRPDQALLEKFRHLVHENYTPVEQTPMVSQREEQR